MPSPNVAASGRPSSRAPLVLNALPSELRRLIVFYLAPDPEHLRPGCKRDLKNANLAHSCLREWVTEYMFKDMALIHVLPGMSSHLELFAISQENAGLLKFVKHIVVQTLLMNPPVPTAIRWEVGVHNPFALHLEEISKQRLCKKFGAKNPRQLSHEQQKYCTDYHRALVEPFTNNRRWHQLLHTANATWGQIFRYFTDLEEISVGCCERVNHPRPTSTHSFLLQHGKDVMGDAYPEFVEDPTTNLAWASSVVCKSAPPTVQSLRLSMSNMDNFSSVSTVNRLLSLAYRQLDPVQSSLHITRLDLSLCGAAGTHGDRDWHGDTGSAGSVRFWRSVLNSLHSLQYLALHNDLTTDENIRFSPLDNSDPKACLLEWLLPGLVLGQLRTLRICDFFLDKASIVTTLSAHWPRLENIIFDDIQLMLRTTEDTGELSAHLEHLQGCSWFEVCRELSEKYPDLRIELNRPVSNVNGLEDYRLNKKFIELMQPVNNLVLKTQGPYSLFIKSL